MRFENVYFITSTAYAGKSTMVHLLAEKHSGIECFLELFAEHCGGIEQYFEQSGLSTADLALIRRKLLPYI